MQAFGVTGPGAERLTDRLVGRLEGRVGVVRSATGDGGLVEDRRTAAAYELSDRGWRATGEDLSLDGVLDRLAPDHGYAIAVDFPDARLPQVALDGAETHESPFLEYDDADTVDLDALVAAVGDLEPHETLESLVSEVKSSPLAERAGAIATFTGRVRAKEAPDDDPTEHLSFETYEDVAAARMDAISEELEARDGVLEVVMHHRTGVVEYGEDIVHVVVLAGHREEAFRTVEDGINRLKDEVPLFKKEVTTDEEFWVHDR